MSRANACKIDRRNRNRKASMYQLHYFPANANAQAQPNETVLRVGPLELDLIDRTAKRGDRPIDLRPREFHFAQVHDATDRPIADARNPLQRRMALQIRS